MSVQKSSIATTLQISPFLVLDAWTLGHHFRILQGVSSDQDITLHILTLPYKRFKVSITSIKRQNEFNNSITILI